MEIRKFLCQKIGLPKGYLAMKYYLSATKTVATGGYFRNIGLHRPTSIQIFTDPLSIQNMVIMIQNTLLDSIG